MTSRFKLRLALVCSILLAITHAYKYSWQLKPRFSRYHIKKFTLKSIISHSSFVALTFICVNEILVHARDCSVN